MRESRWDRLYGRIVTKFKIEKESTEETEIGKGIKKRQETIIFSTPGGRMKLQRIVRPKIERIKYRYSRLTHRGTSQEPQYSPTETVEIITLYQWNRITNQWEDVNLNGL